MLSLLSFLSPTSFFSGLKYVGMAAAAVAIGAFIYSWDARGHQLDAAQMANATLSANIDTLNAELSLAHQAEEAAVDRLATIQKTDVATQTVIEGISNAPVTDDAPIAPVLRRALDALDGLRHPGTPAPATH